MQSLHDGVPRAVAHRIGGQGGRINQTPFLVGDDQDLVFLGLATRRAGLALGLRGVVVRHRLDRGLEVGLPETTLQPGVLVTQMLDLNP